VRRLLAIAAGVLVLAGGLVVVALAFSSRDDAQVGAASGPGRSEPDRGARHLPAGEHAQVPAGTLPTSGPHRPDLVTADARRLSDDQILHALELGDVVIAYDAARPPAPLRRLQAQVSGPFDAELAAAGQAVILARRPGAGPATALAWRRELRAADPASPALRDFAEAWLGRGASG
jgi:Protein of unknown function (DUF3105)